MHRLLAEAAVAAEVATLGGAAVKRAIDRVLGRARAEAVTPSHAAVLDGVLVECARLKRQRLVPVVNATGVLLHTNLGRAPLAAEALAAVERAARDYANLEYDLDVGGRGSRHDTIAESLRDATGAPDGLVVNNGAAAVLLVLDTFAKGREAIVARNQLIEIGGGFRLPDVLARSGATPVEVGTTNRVYLRDFEAALSPRTALLLRVHPSNFAVEGFVCDVSGVELAALGRRVGLPVLEDLGSGALDDLATYGLAHERTVQEALHDGIDLVTFSGDKLLGGPQAGLIVGSAARIARLRANPLVRALRVDKMTLAALAATLDLHRTRADRERIPLYRMLAANPDGLGLRAAAYTRALSSARVVPSQARTGGGTLPTATLPSLAIVLPTEHPDALLRTLRHGDPPIVALAAPGAVLFDLRTIAPNEDAAVIAAIARA